MQYKTENLEHPGSIRIHGSDNQLRLRNWGTRVNGPEVLFGKSDVGKYRKGNGLDNQHASKPIDQRSQEADANR